MGGQPTHESTLLRRIPSSKGTHTWNYQPTYSEVMAHTHSSEGLTPTQPPSDASAPPCPHRLHIGVLVLGTCQPMFQRNAIHSSYHGLVARGGDTGLVRDNKIYKCKRSGVLIEDSGSPKVEKNLVSDNQCGLMLADKSLGVVKDNLFIDNAQWAAEISEATTVELMGNRSGSCTARAMGDV